VYFILYENVKEHMCSPVTEISQWLYPDFFYRLSQLIRILFSK